MLLRYPFIFLTLQGNEIIHRLQSELRTSKSKVKYSFSRKSYRLPQISSEIVSNMSFK